MSKTTLLIVAGLLAAAFTGFAAFETFKHRDIKYHDLLNEIAHKINKSNTTWKAGSNSKWINSDIDGVRAHMGNLEKEGDFLNEVVSTEAATLPDAFDARVQWGDACPSLWEVRDQSNCGSCWAFGAVESITDRHCIHLGENIRISAQDLLTCCPLCGMGCNGGYPSAALHHYVNYGLVTGDLYGTTGWCRAYTFAPCAHHVESSEYPPCTGELPTPKCVKECDAGSTFSYKTNKHHGSKAYSVKKNQKAIMTEIMTNGPVEAGFTVYEDFLTYKSGVYQHVTGKALGGHAIKIVGWGVDNGTPFWTVVNSWNNSWGNNGTFNILRGKNECGIEAGVVAALPKN